MKVKIFLVGKGPICELETDFNIKVYSLKQKVLSETGIPVEQQSLFYAGKRLSDEKSLFESDLPAKSDVVTLLLMTAVRLTPKVEQTNTCTYDFVFLIVFSGLASSASGVFWRCENWLFAVVS
eukprot:TRINITY_DN1619_c0_g1_i1.p1 TRINITY_DN1619_c0_g1~~TRINITY_DN1619_c0_g1_i1.p1  ORF type:complete len:123 (+),score=11.64 TRINITY_DN1619_c0_g1_i1:72-440(+)